MKKLIIVFLLLISVGVVASNDELRSIVEPLFDSGEGTDLSNNKKP